MMVPSPSSINQSENPWICLDCAVFQDSKRREALALISSARTEAVSINVDFGAAIVDYIQTGDSCVATLTCHGRSDKHTDRSTDIDRDTDIQSTSRCYDKKTDKHSASHSADDDAYSGSDGV